VSSNDPPPYPGPQDPHGQQPHGQQPYGDQPPYGWSYPGHDQPYGQPYPGQQGQPPYGQPYPQPQEYGGGGYPPPMPGYGYQPPVENPRGKAIGALIANIAVTLLCCPPFGIAGIVVSAMAMSRSDTQPESAGNLTKWGWGLAAASAVLGVVVVAIYIALVVNNPDFVN